MIRLKKKRKLIMVFTFLDYLKNFYFVDSYFDIQEIDYHKNYYYHYCTVPFGVLLHHKMGEVMIFLFFHHGRPVVIVDFDLEIIFDLFLFHDDE